MSSVFSQEQINCIQGVFDCIDKNGDGVIDKNEFLAALKEVDITISNEEIEKKIKEADKDGDGKINKTEFLAHLQSQME